MYTQRFLVTTAGNAPVAATNNNNAVTGNQSAKWAGIAVTNAGAAGNVAANAGLTMISTVTEIDRRNSITSLVVVTVAENLLADVANYIVIDPETFRFDSKITIINATLLGVLTSATGITTTPPIAGAVADNALGDGRTLKVDVRNNQIIIKILTGQQANVQGKKLIVEFEYINAA